MLNLDVELRALRAIFNQDETYTKATQAQLVALNSLLNKGLTEPGNRIPVLRYITGLWKLTSSKQLTLHTVSTLIEELKENGSWELSELGEELIEACEERVEELARGKQERNHPVGDAPRLPGL